MGEFTEHFVRVPDGLSLYLRDYPAQGGGNRLPVICLHGLTRNSADFENLAQWIAPQGRRVIVPDMRGRARSDRDPEPMHYHNETYAGDVAHVLDALGAPRAVFVGTSMGGLITMTLTGSAPERIAGAVLNDIGPILNPAGIARIAGYVGKAMVFASWNELIAAIRTVQASQFPDADDAFWNAFAHHTGRELPDGTVTLDYDPMIGWALANSGRPSTDMRPLFAALAKKPLLVLHGALSDLLTETELHVMRELAPSLAVADIPRVGHAPTLDEPASRDALSRFLVAAP